MSPERESLITDNLGLAHSIVRQFQPKVHHRILYGELLAMAFDGLMYAASKYTDTRGSKFSSFAYMCIYHRVIRGINEAPYGGNDYRRTITDHDLACRNAEADTSFSDRRVTTDKIEGLYEAMRCAELSSMEKRVLKFRFFDEFTFKEAASKVAKSKERVRQIELSALDKIRPHLERILAGRERQV